jgi:hypothetical protein
MEIQPNAKNDGEIDLEKARLDPGGVFGSPEELRDHAELTQAQKIDLLQRCAYDARELAVAEDEGMIGGEPSQLARVLSVLDSLTGGIDVQHSPPTEQKGL